MWLNVFYMNASTLNVLCFHCLLELKKKSVKIQPLPFVIFYYTGDLHSIAVISDENRIEVMSSHSHEILMRNIFIVILRSVILLVIKVVLNELIWTFVSDMTSCLYTWWFGLYWLNLRLVRLCKFSFRSI